jgi:sigma-E factor negative regulatory protein RseA
VKEQLSALVDNELAGLEERRLLQELERDPQLRAAWQRYHLIRAAMLNELDHVPSAASAERLAARLAAEPPVTVSRFAGRLPGIVGSLAIAATVAGIAIFGLQTLNQPVAPKPAPLASAKPDAPRVASAAPAEAVVAVQAVRAASPRWETPEPDEERLLNLYLVQHSEFASVGMRGMLPSYVRVVGQSGDQ